TTMALSPATDPQADQAADTPPSPEHILQVAMGFWASKTLLSAVELKLFTHLAHGPQDARQLTAALELHPRSALAFLESLVALNMLNRTDGIYSNTRDADLFLDQAKPSYVGGLLEMANSRLYPFWGSLTEALRTGEPQNEAKQGGNVFEAI